MISRCWKRRRSGPWGIAPGSSPSVSRHQCNDHQPPGCTALPGQAYLNPRFPANRIGILHVHRWKPRREASREHPRAARRDAPAGHRPAPPTTPEPGDRVQQQGRAWEHRPACGHGGPGPRDRITKHAAGPGGSPYPASTLEVPRKTPCKSPARHPACPRRAPRMRPRKSAGEVPGKKPRK
jgi:hypothetical protein